MLKNMAVFVLSLPLICVQGYAQTHKAQKTSKGNNRPTASVAAPQEDSPHLQSEPQKNVEAEVRVVSTPAKDRYDKAAVWINLALAVIGTLGIGFAVFTLKKLERQTTATEASIQLQEMAFRQWVDLVNWKTFYAPSIAGQPAFLKITVDVVNPTGFPLTIHKGRITVGDNTTFFLADEFFITPKNPYTVRIELWLAEKQEADFLRTGLWFSVRGEMPHVGILGKLQPQPICGHLTCVNGPSPMWEPEMPAKEAQEQRPKAN